MGTITASAQEYLDAHLQFKTMHYWRGLIVGNAPVFVTSVGYFSKNFSAFVWSGVSLTSDYKEVDPVISYKLFFRTKYLSTLSYKKSVK